MTSVSSTTTLGAVAGLGRRSSPVTVEEVDDTQVEREPGVVEALVTAVGAAVEARRPLTADRRPPTVGRAVGAAGSAAVGGVRRPGRPRCRVGCPRERSSP